MDLRVAGSDVARKRTMVQDFVLPALCNAIRPKVIEAIVGDNAHHATVSHHDTVAAL